MKFCKNLQRVVDISDPEWAPYWTNYKMLKKIIKELPSLVPSEDGGSRATTASAHLRARAPSTEGEKSSLSHDSPSSSVSALQKHGDQTAELKENEDQVSDHSDVHDGIYCASDPRDLERSPGEITFFKLIHIEFKKATYFFEKAQQEFLIREERVREGMEIMKQPNSIMVSEKWSMLAKSIFKLYKDLLLLETFAIMTYCSFSKILKKHDKVTGHQTRSAFMANVVNKANFNNYPKVLEMISRCERLYEEVSARLLQEGKEGLYEDERLFINMISRLNEQTLDHPDAPYRDQEARRPCIPGRGSFRSDKPLTESVAVSTLRSLVEENDARAEGEVSEDPTGEDGDSVVDKKRSGEELSHSSKRLRTESF